ncbi:SusC/RagA family TonB-linked outer membrane protein [Formosa sp. PL04]|uniref:SusC/RagA family TonB-linked outer membrane protein n=1 Tax=Formosa sp. PL04 TaxID=3081755 RepID=UPI0029814E88|nr:SusC/RagA family TonB-linked outer membrane protein [Formosa sp. PL04]MDW5290786.1 SusC/RagA family TonB-linked outer membrane protein [Formosa sp. PL04]
MYKNYKFKKSSVKPALFMALLLSLSYSSVFAVNDTNKLVTEARVNEQDLTIRGTVFSKDDGMPAAGVNVILQGASGVGTVTDFDGNYVIDVPSSSSVLVFSYVGFISQEISVGGKTKIDVELVTNVSELDEVIVVGFGTQKKQTLTGAVAQVKGEDVIRGKGTSSAALALQGEVSGVTVTRTSSRPGNEGTSINIRGAISVNNITPLIMLDGVEITETELSAINANDIATYSVLKDASASIFGTKAAGGVILVTTKRGKEGKVVVNYKTETQLNFAQEFPLANMSQWAESWLIAGANDEISYVDKDGVLTQTAGTYRFFTEEQTQMMADGTFPLAPNPFFANGVNNYYADVNQFDAQYGTTVSERHDLSLSGGNENVTFRTSFGYANERSPMTFTYDGQKRYNFRTNLEYKISNVISTEFTVSYDNRTINTPTQGIGNGIQDASIFPLYNPAGQYYDTFGGNNVLAMLDEGGRTTNNQELFRLGGRISLDLNQYVEGLSGSYFGNITSRNQRTNARKTSVTMYDWVGNVTFTPTTLLNSNINVTEDDYIFQNHVFQLNYNRTFGKNTLGVMAGYTAEQTQVEKYSLFRSNMADDSLDDINTGDVATQTNGGGSSEVGLLSYLGKINYDYDSTYLLELIGRRDGSSRLHEDYRWKNFFGGSAGIVISEMDFMEDSGFNMLKLRASYGSTGSVTGIGAYDYYSSMGSGSTIFGTTPELYTTANISGITSLDRSWETVTTANIGIDIALFNNRLTGTADYYVRTNDDMLVNITYPQILGATAPKTNSGTFETKGYEIAATWRDQIGDFRYNIGVQYWDNNSEVVEMEGKTTIIKGVNTILEGKPLNAIYAYKTDGILSTEAQVLDYYNQYGFIDGDQLTTKPGTKLPLYRSADRLVPGTWNKVDVNEDGIINEDDLIYVGDANPHHSFGINLGFSYKNFDFSTFFQGVGQQNIVRTGSLSYPFMQWWTNQNPTFLGNTWTEDNQGAEYPAAFYNGARKTWNYGDLAEPNVIRAAYMRAKVISVGYSIPQEVLERIGVSKLRFSLTGNDLFVISNIEDGLDPEFGDNTRQGGMIPFASTVILGLDLTF